MRSDWTKLGQTAILWALGFFDVWFISVTQGENLPTQGQIGERWDIMSHQSDYLRTAREGNVFRGVCQSYCSQGVSLWTDTPLRTEIPRNWHLVPVTAAIGTHRGMLSSSLFDFFTFDNVLLNFQNQRGMKSAESLLVRHLPTYWRPAWRLNYFFSKRS